MTQYQSFNMSFQQKVESRVAKFRVDMPDQEEEGRELVNKVCRTFC